jgi:hypothetical protein
VLPAEPCCHSYRATEAQPRPSELEPSHAMENPSASSSAPIPLRPLVESVTQRPPVCRVRHHTPYLAPCLEHGLSRFAAVRDSLLRFTAVRNNCQLQSMDVTRRQNRPRQSLRFFG